MIKQKEYERINKSWFVKVFILFLFGIAFGFMFGVLTPENKNILLIENLEEFLLNYNLNKNSLARNFIEIFLKNARTVIIIWVLGFLRFGGYISLFIIFMKGISLGFTGYFLCNIHEIDKNFNIIIVYIAQNISLTFLVFVLVYKSIEFIKKKKMAKNYKNINNTNIIVEHIIWLILSLIATGFICVLGVI